MSTCQRVKMPHDDYVTTMLISTWCFSKTKHNTMSISRWDRLNTMSSTMSNLINRFNPIVKCSYLSHAWSWNSLVKKRGRFNVYWSEARVIHVSYYFNCLCFRITSAQYCVYIKVIKRDDYWSWGTKWTWHDL